GSYSNGTHGIIQRLLEHQYFLVVGQGGERVSCTVPHKRTFIINRLGKEFTALTGSKLSQIPYGRSSSYIRLHTVGSKVGQLRCIFAGSICASKNFRKMIGTLRSVPLLNGLGCPLGRFIIMTIVAGIWSTKLRT